MAKLIDNIQPQYVMAVVDDTYKKNNPFLDTSNLLYVEATILEDRTEHQISLLPILQGAGNIGVSKQKYNFVSNITKVLLVNKTNEKPKTGDIIQAILISSSDTKTLNIDGYCEKIVGRSKDVIENSYSFTQDLQKFFKNVKNSLLPTLTEPESIQEQSFQEDEFLLAKIVVEGQSQPTSTFGNRIHPISKQVINHRGMDIGASIGSPIRAMAAGEVIVARNQDDFGLNVRIKHEDGNISLYAHASELLVSQGDFVNANQRIAKVGNTGRSTGPHLHLELYYLTGENNRNWLNPTKGLDLYGLR